jgi:hypothetical protein
VNERVATAGRSVVGADPAYGWLIVATLAVTETVSWGVLYYAFAVFLAVIRAAVREDRDAVRDVVRSAYARYVNGIGREPAPMGADYAALLAAGELWVTTDDSDRPIGVLVMRPEGRALLLEKSPSRRAIKAEASGER